MHKGRRFRNRKRRNGGQKMVTGLCRKAVFVLLALALTLGVGTSVVWGQEVTASITGTVTDPSGGTVAGATVSAKDVARGTVSTATTSAEGTFYIQRIPVGTYDVKVEAAGFQTVLQPGIVLVLNQTARLEIQLKVGQTTQIVEV